LRRCENAAETTAAPARAAAARPTPAAAVATRRTERRLRLHRDEALALRALAGELTGAAHGLGLLARLLLGGLLVVVAELHLAEDTLPLELLLQGAQRLIHIVIANNYLQAEPPSCRQNC